MKFVVFGDLHGNVYALKAMIQQINISDLDGLIFLGDIVGYFTHQEESINFMKSLPNLYAVMGNHDYNYLSVYENSEKRAYFAKKYGKSYLNYMSVSAKKYLENQPESIELCLAGKKIFVAHGSIESHLEGRIYPDTKIDEDLYGKYDFVFLGHTHYRMCRNIGKTLVINPGSLGQPRDYLGYSYCIVDFETSKYIFKTVNIDQISLLNEMQMYDEEMTLISYIRSKIGEDV